jgi:F-type H+-transporting ATPase subunit gamma
MGVRGMASEQELRARITSTTNIQKITKSMKMVAAAKMKKEEERLANARSFGKIFERLFAGLSSKSTGTEMVIPVSSDRGLCGGVNTAVSRSTRNHTAELEAEGTDFNMFMIGDKSRGQLQRTHGQYFSGDVIDYAKFSFNFTIASMCAARLLTFPFSTATIIHNKFISMIAYETELLKVPSFTDIEVAEGEQAEANSLATYNFEPEAQDEVLENLQQFCMASAIYSSAVQSSAAEMSQRMSAMDNATTNAGDMIEKFTLQYNRARQARITTELTEIVAGAESLKSAES